MRARTHTHTHSSFIGLQLKEARNHAYRTQFILLAALTQKSLLAYIFQVIEIIIIIYEEQY